MQSTVIVNSYILWYSAQTWSPQQVSSQSQVTPDALMVVGTLSGETEVFARSYFVVKFFHLLQLDWESKEQV